MFPVPDDGRPVQMQHNFSFVGTAAPEGSPTATANEFVVTRLHYRYGTGGLREDLVFRAAPPVEGGRENSSRGDTLSQEASPSAMNNFQARYAIRHPWEGAIRCAEPVRHIWGPAPTGLVPVTVAPPHGARSAVQLDELLVSSVSSTVAPPLVVPAAPAAEPIASPIAAPPAPAASSGLCTARTGASSPLALALSACALLVARRRRTSR